jgi:eukaryotic-like serine/threonine-protein kinase
LLSATYKICSSCEARTGADARHCPACGHDLTAVEAREGDPYVGVTLADKYLIETLIGEGAMGRVYKAKQIPLGKPFAVKILAPHLMNDEASHARFANEAHNCASLNHPNCISVVDYGRSPEGITYIVMEYIAGRTLEELIATEHPLSRERVVDLVLQVLAALAEAHGLGILHRDLKPENILVQQLRTHGELAKVLDFGIAKLMDSTAGGPGLTSHGMVCGTPEYMSPEQARGLKLDARSDLYAVGVILYQMLAGRPPFESTSAVEILHKHLHEEPIPPSRLIGTDAHGLEEICLRAMAKDPAARFESAQTFREALVTAAAAPNASVACDQCGARIRADHRFCPTCGAAVTARDPAPARAPARRSSSAGSGFNIPRHLGEPTAEVVVRKFPLPLVDRDDALERAKRRLTLTPTQQTQSSVETLVVTGPRGVGKTRLGDEIASLAEQLGWSVHWVGADPSGARSSLWPIQSMIGQLLELQPGCVTTQDLGRVANLVGLTFEELPGLAELFELHGPAHDVEHRVRRRECLASAVQALLRGGRGRPLLLAFDDVEIFDAPSREVLRRLASIESSGASAPVVVLCMANEADVAWLGDTVEALQPLGASAVERVGRALTMETRPNSKLPEALARIAPLTPLKLECHLRLLAGGVQAGANMTEAELVKTRIEQQGASARMVLEIASVLGERFPEADLVDMFQQEAARRSRQGDYIPGGALDQALAELHVDGLLVVVGNGERAFAHRVIHDVVYGHLPEDRRHELHALAARISRLAKSLLAVRAVHLVRGASPDAVDAVLAAARRAQRLFDDNAVSDFAVAGLRMLAAASDARLPLQAELTLLASRAMRTPADAEHAAELLRAQLELGHPPAVEASLRAELGLALARVERFDAAIVSLKKALGPAIAAGDREAMAQVYRNLGRVYARKGDVERAIAELREGLDMFTLGEGPRADVDLDLWPYMRELCQAYRDARNATEARSWCEHALFQAERRGDRLGLLRCHTLSAWILRDLKQLALAEQHVARALEEARHFGDRLTTAELLIERARARAARGRLVEARRCCEEALRLATSLQWKPGIQHAERAIAMLTRQGVLASESSSTLSIPRNTPR